MAPLHEHMISGTDVEYPMNQLTPGTLASGEEVDFVSTIDGGFIRRESPTADEILEPGQVIQLSGGTNITVESLKDQAVQPSPIDGGLV